MSFCSSGKGREIFWGLVLTQNRGDFSSKKYSLLIYRRRMASKLQLKTRIFFLPFGSKPNRKPFTDRSWNILFGVFLLSKIAQLRSGASSRLIYLLGKGLLFLLTKNEPNQASKRTQKVLEHPARP